MTRQPQTPLVEASAKAQARADWEARFERAPIPPPRLYPGDVPAPDYYTREWLGWKCPACGDVTNEFLLGNNHGYHLHMPGSVPYRARFGETCTALELRKAHALFDQRRAEVRHLIDQGLTDEEIAAQTKWWNAKTIAGYRKDDAKTARLAAKAAKGEVVTVGHGDQCPCAFCGGPCSCKSCREFRGDASSEVAKQEVAPLTLF